MRVVSHLPVSLPVSLIPCSCIYGPLIVTFSLLIIFILRNLLALLMPSIILWNQTTSSLTLAFYFHNRCFLRGLCAAGFCLLFGQPLAVPCPLRLGCCVSILFNLGNDNFVLCKLWPLSYQAFIMPCSTRLTFCGCTGISFVFSDLSLLINQSVTMLFQHCSILLFQLKNKFKVFIRHVNWSWVLYCSDSVTLSASRYFVFELMIWQGMTTVLSSTWIFEMFQFTWILVSLHKV